MVALRIHTGHDPTAAIVRDGKIIGDVPEESFSRIKQSNNFPNKSIELYLKMADLENINEVDYIRYSSMTTSK